MDHIWGVEAGEHGLAFAYLVGTAAVLWAMSQARRSFWLFSLLVFPGTLCHEFCHWVVGKLLNGRPVHFAVFPKRVGHGFVLGSVVLSNLRWYNAFFVGLAPLLLLAAAYGLFLWRLGGHPVLGWKEAGAVFFLANLLFGAVPSGQDLRMAARSPIGWLLLAGALGYGWMRLVKPRADGVARPSTRLEQRAWRPECKEDLPLRYEIWLDNFSAFGFGPGGCTRRVTGPPVGSSSHPDTNPFSLIAVCSKPVETISTCIAPA